MAANLPNPGQPIWRGPYYGNAWGLRNYLKAALDEVGTKIQVEVTGETPGEKRSDRKGFELDEGAASA